MSGSLNVRGLISKFEHLSSNMTTRSISASNHDQEEVEVVKPLAKRSMSIGTAMDRKNEDVGLNAKLCRAEMKIEEIRAQVANIEQVTNDEFVKLLFKLLDQLIFLNNIDFEDSSYTLKKRKEMCIKSIIDCKEELVKSLDLAQETDDEEVFNDAEARSVSPKQSALFTPINQRKMFFESTEDFTQSPILQRKKQFEANEDWSKSSPSLNSSESSDASTVIEVSKISSAQRSLSEAGIKSENTLSVPKETITRNKSVDDSIDFKSLAEMRKLFQTSQEIKKIPKNHKVHTNSDILATLEAELMHYEKSAEQLNEIIKLEALEENLADLFEKIKTLSTHDDESLQNRKDTAIATADIIQRRINEKLGSQDNDQINEINDYLQEIERYKALVEEFNPKEKSQGDYLEENIYSVLVSLDKVKTSENNELNKKKLAGIKDLSLVLNKLNEKRDEYNKQLKKEAEKKRIAEEARIAAAEARKAAEVAKQSDAMEEKRLQEAKRADVAAKKAEEEAARKAVEEAAKKAVDEARKKFEDAERLASPPLRSPQEYQTKTPPSTPEPSDRPVSNTSAVFNEILEGLDEEEELRNAKIYDCAVYLDELMEDIGIMKNVAKDTSMFDTEEMEMFLNNVEELKDKVNAAETCADEDLVRKRDEGLAVVLEIINGLIKNPKLRND